jgi:hypothetical protein
MKIFQTLCIGLSLLSPTISIYAHAQKAGSSNSVSTFTIDKRMEMPGETLKPGKYTIQILDHLSDRMIVRVSGPTSKVQFVLLAVPAVGKKDTAGLVPWRSPVDGTPAMRGFVFPAGYEIEFVYPKSEAAALAKANDGTVLAVDPDSEGRPALAQMSTEDLTVVHLWMLSLTPVGPDHKAPTIQAQAYQAPAVTTRPAKTSKSSTTGTDEVASVSKSQSEPLTPRKRPAITALPHTASELPLIVLGGFFSLLAAFCLRIASGSSDSRLSDVR